MRSVELILLLSILAGCSADRMTSTGLRPDPDPTTVDVSYCAGLQPNWVAFQDGGGAWTQAQPTSVGQRITFRHAFSSDRGAIATARNLGNGLTTLAIQYGVLAELPAVGDTIPSHCGPPVSKSLLGTVAGTDSSDLVIVNGGFGSRDIVSPAQRDTFAIHGLTAGPQDILATKTTFVNGTSALERVILRRSPELPDSAVLPVLDFNSAEAFAPAIVNLTLTGLGPDGAIAQTRLHTSNSESELSFMNNAPTAATRPTYAIPESRLLAGDLQFLGVTASPSATSPNTIRSASVYFRSPVDQTLKIGAPATLPALSTVSTTPALRLRAKFDSQHDYDRQTTITYQQAQATIVSVSMSAAFAGLTSAGYDLIVPDLSSVTGFDSRWALRPGVEVFWIANRSGGTLGIGPNATPVNGATSRTAIVFDDFTP